MIRCEQNAAQVIGNEEYQNTDDHQKSGAVSVLGWERVQSAGCDEGDKEFGHAKYDVGYLVRKSSDFCPEAFMIVKTNIIDLGSYIFSCDHQHNVLDEQLRDTLDTFPIWCSMDGAHYKGLVTDVLDQSQKGVQ